MTLLPFILAAAAYLAPNRDHTDLASAIARVVTDSPALFADDEDRRKTAALIVAIGYRESTLRNDAVSKTDDHCFLQIHGRPDLTRNVEECLRVGLAMLRESMRACPAHPIAVYAAGPDGCTNERAQRISFDRMWLAKRLLTVVKPEAGEPGDAKAKSAEAKR